MDFLLLQLWVWAGDPRTAAAQGGSAAEGQLLPEPPLPAASAGGGWGRFSPRVSPHWASLPNRTSLAQREFQSQGVWGCCCAEVVRAAQLPRTCLSGQETGPAALVPSSHASCKPPCAVPDIRGCKPARAGCNTPGLSTGVAHRAGLDGCGHVFLLQCLFQITPSSQWPISQILVQFRTSLPQHHPHSSHLLTAFKATLHTAPATNRSATDAQTPFSRCRSFGHATGPAHPKCQIPLPTQRLSSGTRPGNLSLQGSSSPSQGTTRVATIQRP